MSDFRFCLIALIIAPLVGCGVGNLEVVSWEKGQNSKSLAVIENIEKSDFKRLKVKDKEILFAAQKNGDLTIEDTFIKKVQDKSGQTYLAKAAYLKHNTKSFGAIHLTHDELKTRYAYIGDEFLKHASKVLVTDEGRYKPAFKIEYIDDRGVPWTLLVDSNLRRISEKVSGANLFETKVFLFPDGPRLSKLLEVSIKMDELNPFLAMTGLKVSSTSAPAFDDSPDHLLKLTPEDLRFDEVQAYLYINKVEAWIKNVLG
ncbi:MAG: hypothetical protein ACXWR0_13200, partial [Bdellovibrio sp.]